ncbi:MAG TPA: biotin-dependent carboxyltransferase family protein [Gemmatimonadales bacterium]|nr:biotin-dependent carboxyltransferase family protein [Gemmatimonadales bacterium]
MITVVRAPPFATVQDLGRYGHRAAAVPVSGAMDPVSLARANGLVGNEPGLAAVEWGIGAGSLRLAPNTVVGWAGADVSIRREGDMLTVTAFRSGAWLYIAAQGGIDVPVVLGSRSTYLPGSFGGLEGRLLRAGDRLPTGRANVGRADRDTVTQAPTFGASAFEIVPGPDRHLLHDRVWKEFLETEWTVSRAVSRAGYCLDGPVLAFEASADLPSAPVCPGAVQVPPGGRPIVLMPDGPTVGGYPRIAVVVSGELSRLAQRRPGEPVRFSLR